jgi:hypothetical protein
MLTTAPSIGNPNRSTTLPVTRPGSVAPSGHAATPTTKAAVKVIRLPRSNGFSKWRRLTAASAPRAVASAPARGPARLPASAREPW